MYVHYVGISLRLAEPHYNVTEGSSVTIMILADKPSVNRKFVVTLNTLTTKSTTAASGMSPLPLATLLYYP